MKNLAVYIHWPFCVSKCPYCDFASRPMPDREDGRAWTEACIKEIERYGDRLGPRIVTSVYFGGGTPSLMASDVVAALIEKTAALWQMSQDCEITLEANPTSSEIAKFKAFRSAGVNRLSLGVQSFDDAALRFLGRAHDAAEARAALEAAASVFTRFSFDLIYARAGQTLRQWQDELNEALAFNTRHLSLYQLTIEKGSMFAKRAVREVLTVSPDEAAAMFELTQDVMATARLPAYEISNHARAGQESRHNLTYWRYEDYIGIGPSAHGRFIDAQGIRWATENSASPHAWQTHEDILNEDAAMREAVLMGLRMREGIDLARWKEKFSCGLDGVISLAKIDVLQSEGLICYTSESLSPTKNGLARADALASFLLK